MKEKIIEAAGKAWRFLGQNGEINVDQLPQALKEKEPVVFQALGWLAREDKISYSTKNRRTFVSLVGDELQSFNSLMYNVQNQAQNQNIQATSTNGKRIAKR